MFRNVDSENSEAGESTQKRIQQVAGCCEQDMLGVWVWVGGSQEGWEFLGWLRTSESRGLCSMDLVGYLVGWCVCWLLG